MDTTKKWRAFEMELCEHSFSADKEVCSLAIDGPYRPSDCGNKTFSRCSWTFCRKYSATVDINSLCGICIVIGLYLSFYIQWLCLLFHQFCFHNRINVLAEFIHFEATVIFSKNSLYLLEAIFRNEILVLYIKTFN